MPGVLYDCCRVIYEGAVAKRIESSTELLRKWLFSGAAAGSPRHQAGGTMLAVQPACCTSEPDTHVLASAFDVQTLVHCWRMLRRTI